MMRTVEPHDLEAACKECGTTLSALSECTGIPEHELLAFAAGTLPLNGRDRSAILSALCERAPERTTPMTAVEWLRSDLALKMLMKDVREEEREEDERLDLI